VHDVTAVFVIMTFSDEEKVSILKTVEGDCEHVREDKRASF